MTTAFSMMPFFRSSLVNDLFDSMLVGQDGATNYPAYNIEKRSEDSYAITLAVPGFADKDLNITVQRDRLVVTGQVAASEDQNVAYLYRGIGVQPFERTFRLGNYIKVTGAELKDGLLRIQLQREVPEEAKPRTIAISAGSSGSAGSGTKVIEANATPGQN